MTLSLDEVRRLTGPNLLWDQPGAILDVWIKDVDKSQVAECWQGWSRRLLDAFGWSAEQSIFRLHDHGANLAISAPLDALFTACDLAELSWACCVAEVQQQALPDWGKSLDQLRQVYLEESNPVVLQLNAAASARGVSCLIDEDQLTLGAGESSQTWAINAVPDPKRLDWSKFKSIPCAYITGTNGKSTSVRLAAEVALSAGVTAGITSTDFIRVAHDVLDYGDYSGPGGARRLLRDPRTELAFLEVARGGILRRGLPIKRVDAALITNVARDHLGQYGINTVGELAETKFVVAKGLGAQGVLVLNADNAPVVTQANRMTHNYNLCWFSTDCKNPLVQQQLESGARAVTIDDGSFYYYHLNVAHRIVAVDACPITFGGAAQHNIENILGVIGLTMAMKIPLDAIRQGIQSFSSDAKDNPGRGNTYSLNGVQVIVDFAHNQHSMQAIVDMVKKMPAKRRHVMFSHAGDRSDDDIYALTDAAIALNAETYTIAELEKYLRGRERNEVSDLVFSRLRQQQIAVNQIIRASGPLEGVKQTMAVAKPGDIVLLFVLDQREQVHQWLSQAEA